MFTKKRNGDTVMSAIVNLIVEEGSRKVRNLCPWREVNLEQDINQDVGTRTAAVTTIKCSCHALWGGEGVLDCKYWHIDYLMRNEMYNMKVRNILDYGLHVQNRTYFGDILNATETGTTVSVFSDSVADGRGQQPIASGGIEAEGQCLKCSWMWARMGS